MKNRTSLDSIKLSKKCSNLCSRWLQKALASRSEVEEASQKAASTTTLSHQINMIDVKTESNIAVTLALYRDHSFHRCKDHCMAGLQFDWFGFRSFG